MAATPFLRKIEPLHAQDPPAPPECVTMRPQDSLWFRDGYEYCFRDGKLLETAITCAPKKPGSISNLRGYEHNQDLAMLGDNAARIIMQEIRIDRGHGTILWHEWHDRGVASNAYLAEMCDIKGLHRYMRWGEPNKDKAGNDIPFNCHERATAVEAVIGAVWKDSGRDFEIVKEVMRRFGIWWPESSEYDAAFDRHLRRVRAAHGWF